MGKKCGSSLVTKNNGCMTVLDHITTFFFFFYMSFFFFLFLVGKRGGGGVGRWVSSALVLMSSYKNNANNYILGYKLVGCATHFSLEILWMA